MGSIGAIIAAIFILRLINAGNITIPTLIKVCLAKSFFLGLLAILAAGLLGDAGVALLAPATVLIWTPTVVLEWVAVPLRLPRVAYWTARICRPLGLAREPCAGGIIYGALALARKKRAADATLEWLTQRFDGTARTRGAGVVALGLIAALRGDAHLARSLFGIADSWPTQLVPRKARVIARDWLVADAARSGNWRAVIRLGRRGWRSLRWSHAMARIAERLTGDPQACGDALLWLCFLLAPRRFATLAPLRRGLAGPPRASAPPDASLEAASPVAVSPPTEGPGPEGPDTEHPAAAADSPQALADLARAIESRHDGETLVRSVGIVDGHLDALRIRIEQRLHALGGRGDADAVVSAFRARLIDLVVPLIEDDPHLAAAPGSSPILERAVAQVRLRLFRDIEAQCKDYQTRPEGFFSLLFEWERWAMLRHTAERLLALDPGSESALFQAMYLPVCNFAVLQHNTYKRISLAHDMFTWLLQHATADAQASQLLAKNAKVGAE
jgi:hypothetical protein